MTTTRTQGFDTDHARLNAALAPYVRTEPDGFQWIDASAPTQLTATYRRLMQYGYANGLIPA